LVIARSIATKQSHGIATPACPVGRLSASWRIARNGIMEKQASFRGGHKVAHKAQTFCDLKGSKVVYNKYTGL